MKKKLFLFCFVVFILSGCARFLSTQEETEIETKTQQSILSIETEKNYESYTGKWISWNNPELEDDGGVSLKITVKSNQMTGTFSAWSKNYGRLADAEISGTIEDNKCTADFSDDGRGHSGTIVLLFEPKQIKADVTIHTQDTDFTFPQGTTVLTFDEGNGK